MKEGSVLFLHLFCQRREEDSVCQERKVQRRRRKRRGRERKERTQSERTLFHKFNALPSFQLVLVIVHTTLFPIELLFVGLRESWNPSFVLPTSSRVLLLEKEGKNTNHTVDLRSTGHLSIILYHPFPEY